MLDSIISTDPRASQGVGGDNMTVMIIDLQPKSRPYYIEGLEKEDNLEVEKKSGEDG